jgi:hypothetical protein
LDAKIGYILKQLKLIGKIIVIVGAVSLWVFFSARSDYKWADLIIEQETQKGWTVIAKQDNFADITSPWTLIKTPVTGLWFINNSNTKKLNQEIYLINTQRVSYDYSRTDKDESWELVNIRTKESAVLEAEQDVSDLNINKIKWYKYETGMPGHQIIEFIVNYDKNN